MLHTPPDSKTPHRVKAQTGSLDFSFAAELNHWKFAVTVSHFPSTKPPCPTQREAVLYYDECMLRYSNRDILLTLETPEPNTMSNGILIPSNQQESFRELVLSMLNNADTEAAG